MTLKLCWSASRWPADALNEFFALMGEIEAKYHLTYKRSDDEREAILRSLEDVKAGVLPATKKLNRYLSALSKLNEKAGGG